MKYIALLLTFCLATISWAQAPEKFSRVRINLKNHDISEVAALGLEADHGSYHPGLHLVNDFSATEIEQLKQAGIPYRIEIDDVKQWYKNQNSSGAHTHGTKDGHCHEQSGSPTYDYETPENYSTGSMGGYLTYQQYLNQVDEMFAKFPNLITGKTAIGSFITLEGHPIYSMKISNNPTQDEDEPEVLYTALHHAREPNSLSQTIFYMWYLLENYGTDPEVTFLVDNTEMFFIPMVNPDGYIYNQTQDPSGGGLWRKNMWRDSNGQLKGVDLNRNYGYEWGYDNAGSSGDPNEQTYRGTAAFSEVETQAVKYFCEQHNFLITLNCHTYGNLFVHPWGYEDLLTPEDDTYKALGRAMIDENNFALGTGYEVLGYATNGDADDWMYGETTTKNKIFAYTPEVGPSSTAFWPAAGDIDFLNKSGMRMNLNMSAVTHHYLSLADLNPPLMKTDDAFFKLGLLHAGLAAGTNLLNFATNDSDVSIDNTPIEVDLEHLQEMSLNIPISFAPAFDSPREVTFTVKIDNGFWTREESFEKLISPVDPTLLVSNDMSDPTGFVMDGDWGMTSLTFVSAPTCLTDSPGQDYDEDQNSMVFMLEAVDLSQATQAILNYEAKWEIETDYDYAQILAGPSIDITEMTPLCGKYTNPGTQFQDEDNPIYDGQQQEWVTEEIDLSDFIGQSNIYFAFKFYSDGYVEGDGFYVDNFEINVISNEPMATENILATSYDIFPNPTDGLVQIVNNSNDFPTKYLIKDLLGNTVLSMQPQAKSSTIDLTAYPYGAYLLEVRKGEKLIGTERLVHVKQ